MMCKSLALIGFQSSGKTTLGKQLAHQLGCSFVDTDQLIEQLHPSLSCRQIFQTFGASYFRNLENQVITSLQYQPAIVLATGGGSLLQPQNAEHLKANTTLIYLKTPVEILKKRMEQQKTRPAYLNYQTLEVVYEERTAIYEKWADEVVEMDGLGISEDFNQLVEIVLRMAHFR